jgi:hypothetical protein
VQTFERDHHRRVTAEGERAGHHLVEHDAERVDICGRRDGLALQLFRRDVGGRADHVARIGERRQPALARLATAAREAKVCDDDARLSGRVARGHEHDVRALEVAVDDADAVRGQQRIGHLAHKRQCSGGVHAPFTAQQIFERLARQKLHREEGDLAREWAGDLMSADVEEAADVRVRNLARQIDLAFEPLDDVLLFDDLGANSFERHALAQDRVGGLIDLAHAAARDKAHDAIARGDHVARREAHTPT